MSRPSRFFRRIFPVVLALGIAFCVIPDAWSAPFKVKRSKAADTPVWTPSASDTVATDTAATDTAVSDTMTAAQSHVDTAAKSDTEPTDTLVFSARPGGRFYHKTSFSHAPQPEDKDVIVTDDTENLKTAFLSCPICFESPITEDDFGLEEAIANQVAGIVEFRYRKLDDEAIAGRLNRIGQPMTQLLDRRHLEFYFTPLRSSLEKNAISAGNGYIYFTTGLLNIMEDDDEVAAVLAHEISHAEFRHVLQDFKLSQKLTLITAIASAIINKAGNIGGIFQVLQDYAAQLVMNGFSRQYELEADAGAKWIMESLGRDTAAMRRVLMKLDDLSRDRGDRSSLFESHPEESERIKAFDQTRVFNKTVKGDTVSLRIKFQRPRAVGWFKERSVPALYASLVNETDSDLILTNFDAVYQALDLPEVKVEVSPGTLVIPKSSYGQIKILVIAKQELVRVPRAVTLSCEYRFLHEQPASAQKKREKPGKKKVSFQVDLSE